MKRMIIMGGQMRNKGAQAMTYITMDEVAKRWPDVTPTILDRKANWDSNLKLECINIPLSIQCLMQIPVVRALLKMAKPTAKRYEAIMKETVAVIDISGFALGRSWSAKGMVSYALTRMMAGKRHHFPVYLMPQSFGPFGAKKLTGKMVELLLKKTLPKATVIMSREKQGMEALRDAFGVTKNVCLQPDLVLQNKGVEKENIFCSVPDMPGAEILPGSVAIVPNQKTIVNNSMEKMLKLYRSMIDHLLEKGKNIYLVYHSSEDYSICNEIKALFRDEKRVIVVEKELNCFEYHETVKRFDYIIASRFHSIVLAYRNHTPAIVLGWAVKYQELLGLFGQQDYLFDVRNEIDENDLNARIDKMETEKDRERAKIAEGLVAVQEQNVFDLIRPKEC